MTLDDDQLDEVTAGALPDIVIWDIVGDEGPGGPAGISPEPGGDNDGIASVARLKLAF